MVAERGLRSLIEKQRIVTLTLSAHRISQEDRRENIDSMMYQMENLEQEKVKANSNYRRAQNNLLLLIEGYELPSRKEILDALGSLDKRSESAIEILYTLSDLYFKDSQLDKGHMIVYEMERIEEDYSNVSQVAWDYLNLLKSSNSPGLSQRTHKIGTSLTVGMLKYCNDIQSCTQSGQCANIEQKKQQYRDVSVKSDCNRNSDTTCTVQISSASSLTESKLGNIEADGIPTALTCKSVNKTTSGTEGKRKTHRGSSAYNVSSTLMSPQNDVCRSAKYAKAVHLAIPRDVREYSYKLCQNNSKMSKSRKRSKIKKTSKSRKRYKSRKRPKLIKKSRKRSKSRKRHTSRNRSKSEKRSKFRKRPKFKKKSRKRSKFRKRHASRNRSKSEKRYKSRKRPKFKKKSKSRKILKSIKRSKLSVSPKSKKSLRSRMRTKSRKRSESRKMSMSWKMSRSWKRCKPRKRSKSKNLPKSRNRSKYKKWSVQRGEDEKSGLWVKCTSQSSQVPGRTSYGDEIEKLSPTLTDIRNSRLFRKNEYY